MRSGPAGVSSTRSARFILPPAAPPVCLSRGVNNGFRSENARPATPSISPPFGASGCPDFHSDGIATETDGVDFRDVAVGLAGAVATLPELHLPRTRRRPVPRRDRHRRRPRVRPRPAVLLVRGRSPRLPGHVPVSGRNQPVRDRLHEPARRLPRPQGVRVAGVPQGREEDPVPDRRRGRSGPARRQGAADLGRVPRRQPVAAPVPRGVLPLARGRRDVPPDRLVPRGRHLGAVRGAGTGGRSGRQHHRPVVLRDRRARVPGRPDRPDARPRLPRLGSRVGHDRRRLG